MSSLQVARIRCMLLFVVLVTYGLTLAASSDINVLTGHGVAENSLLVSETPQSATETKMEDSTQTESKLESLSHTAASNDSTETKIQGTTESKENNSDFRHSEKQLIRKKLEMYNSLIKIQRLRAIQSPGSPQQVRHTIQQLPKLIDGTSYYAIDTRLDAGKQRVVIDFVHPFDHRETDEHFRLPLYRRVPPVELSTGNKHAKYYIRDCRVRSLLTGETFGDETYLSVVDDDETSMSWQESGFNSTDHKLSPMRPCGTCTWHMLANKEMRYNKRRTFQVHCSIWDWVSDLLKEHAGTGVFQFDFGIDDQEDKTRTFKAGELERSMGGPDVWPTLPGIALDIPLTSYSHHSFRDSEFRGDPVKLDEDRKGSIAACITVSAPNSRLLLTHADQLLLHGVDHIFYLPMMKSTYGVDEHSPDLRTDPEEYFEHYLEMQNVLANRKDFVTFSKPWLFPMFDVGPPHMQIFGVNSCYGHAMNMGYDWVFVLDVDEFPFPNFYAPLNFPISNLNSPPPVETGGKRKEKPWLQRILRPYDPTKLCELRIQRIKYGIAGVEERLRDVPEYVSSFTIGKTALTPITYEGLGKSILGRDLMLATTHEGFCELGGDRYKKRLSRSKGGILVHSSVIFGIDFNEG